MEAFIHGVILAVGLILPLGVQNLFVFTQGAVQVSLWQALPAVLTASICDTLLILAAVWGLSLVILNFIWLKTILVASGIVFLLYMGWVSWQSKSDNKQSMGIARMSAGKQAMFAASVSLLNPHAILDTIGVIGTSSLHYVGSNKVIFTVSCIMVSWIWFLFLALAGNKIGSLENSGKWLGLLGKFSALFIWGTAVYLGFSLLTEWF